MELKEISAEESADHVFAFVWRENWPWLMCIAIFLSLVYALAPILTPFVIGAVLAYLGDPLVERMERRGLARIGGVIVVFVIVIGATVLGVMLVVPRLEEQIAGIIREFPSWLQWLQNTGLPGVGIHLPQQYKLDGDGIRAALLQHWSTASDFATSFLGRVTHSTPAIIEAILDSVMVPLVAFYLLRDWARLIAWVDNLVPRPLLPRVRAFASETDSVLSALIRGQLLVMISLAAVYSIGLSIVGLDVGLLIGIGAGMVSFIPYLGFFSGWMISSIAIVVQTHELLPLAWVALVFGVGQVLESGVLTPMLVGDRIGLHPVAVIFAVVAGGHLLGFMGVLLALPVAAILAVLLRHTKQSWLQSRLYQGRMQLVAAPLHGSIISTGTNLDRR